LDPHVLRRAFLDFYCRSPLSAERETWGAKSLAEFVDVSLEGLEFWQAWLEEQLYFFLLLDSFRPATQQILEIPRLFAEDRLRIRDALHRICISPNFDRRNPGPDTFVTVVLEQVVGLTVQKSVRDLTTGKKLYDGGPGVFLGKPGTSQADVVAIAISDPRALRFFLLREYQRWMRIDPDDAALERWVRSLTHPNGRLKDVFRAWFNSPEYAERFKKSRLQPNRVFARALLVDLMDQLPEPAEARRLSNALDGLADSQPLRSLLARLVLDSNRAQVPLRDSIDDRSAWIEQIFERFLGRQPSVEERHVFVASLQESDCKTSTVVYAIVSHPEYQVW